MLCQVTGGDATGNAGARKPSAAAAADSSKVKKMKGRVMEDPISDEEEMFAEKSVPRRLTKDNEDFLLERNKKLVFHILRTFNVLFIVLYVSLQLSWYQVH